MRWYEELKFKLFVMHSVLDLCSFYADPDLGRSRIPLIFDPGSNKDKKEEGEKIFSSYLFVGHINHKI